MFRYTGGAITDVGLRRSSNQDSYLYDEETNLFVVADGMGGHTGGETASRLAVETMESFYEARAAQPPTHDPLEELDKLRQAVEAANRAIYEYAQEHAELRGMGTTLVALRIMGQTGFVAHVGDSRLYRFDGERVQRVTKDHSRVQELIDAKQLTESEAESILGRNIITRALGNRPHVEVDCQILDLRTDEVYLLCSDGLCGVINDEQTFQICKKNARDLDSALRILVDRVKENGAPDNVTVILLTGAKFGKPPEKGSEVLTTFELYPDTNRILGKPVDSATALVSTAAQERGGLGDEKIPIKPVAPVVERLDPGDRVLQRSGIESMAVLESLVQRIAEHQGNGGDSLQSPAPFQSGAMINEDLDSTTRLSARQIHEVRSTLGRRSAPASAKQSQPLPRQKTPPTVSAEEPPRKATTPKAEKSETSGSRHSLWPLVACLALILAVFLGFLALGPDSVQFLMLRYREKTGQLTASLVGMPLDREMSRAFLEGVGGSLLAEMRTRESHELELPDGILFDKVAEVVRGCESCGALDNGRPVFLEADQKNPKQFGIAFYKELGNHFRRQGRHSIARKLYRAGQKTFRAAEFRTELGTDYYIEGMELEDKGQIAAALNRYREARDLGAQSSELDKRLGKTAYILGRQLLSHGQTSKGMELLSLAVDVGHISSVERQRIGRAADTQSPAGEETEETPQPEEPKLVIDSPMSFGEDEPSFIFPHDSKAPGKTPATGKNSHPAANGGEVEVIYENPNREEPPPPVVDEGENSGGR